MIKYVFLALIHLTIKTVFLRNKSFCGTLCILKLIDYRTWVSCSARNENLFLYLNQKMLRFTYPHWSWLHVCGCITHYSYSFVNNSQLQISGSRILTFLPVEAKHSQTNSLSLCKGVFRFCEFDGPSQKIFASYNSV